MNKTLKIKLDKAKQLKEYEEELLRWEGDGGNASQLNDILDDLERPLNAGDIFEVKEGHFISEGDNYYLEVTINKIEAIDRID